jgi:hypothetical protein
LDIKHEGWFADAAEESLNRLIERRASEAEAQERVDQAWAESVMRQNLGARAAMRREWAEHFRRMIGVHEQLAEHNRTQLSRLIDEGG